ncbi:hypothetical protein D3C71_1465850 [compost metagenome]
MVVVSSAFWKAKPVPLPATLSCTPVDAGSRLVAVRMPAPLPALTTTLVRRIAPISALFSMPEPVPVAWMTASFALRLVAPVSTRMPAAEPPARIWPAPERASEAPLPARCTAAVPSPASTEPVLVRVAVAPVTKAPVPLLTWTKARLSTVPCVPTTTPVEPVPVSCTLPLFTIVPRFCATKPVTAPVLDAISAWFVRVVATGALWLALARSWACPSTTPAVAPAAFRWMVVTASIVPAAPPSFTMAMPFAPFTL